MMNVNFSRVQDRISHMPVTLTIKVAHEFSFAAPTWNASTSDTGRSELAGQGVWNKGRIRATLASGSDLA